MINIVEGFIESQIDHLKRIQTKLTLFSLQSDKCVSKVNETINYRKIIFMKIDLFRMKY
jgi:hypothetical protein